MPTALVVAFLLPHVHGRGFLFIIPKGKIMQMTIINNPDITGRLALLYKIARVVYAQTGAVSLPLVEAFTSMIKNIVDKTGTDISIVVQDSNLFPSLRKSDINHDRIFVSASNPGFQMCLRTAGRIMSGCLGDCCYGATKYHYADTIPDWALSRGYIADIDGILFYT